MDFPGQGAGAGVGGAHCQHVDNGLRPLRRKALRIHYNRWLSTVCWTPGTSRGAMSRRGPHPERPQGCLEEGAMGNSLIQASVSPRQPQIMRIPCLLPALVSCATKQSDTYVGLSRAHISSYPDSMMFLHHRVSSRAGAPDKPDLNPSGQSAAV